MERYNIEIYERYLNLKNSGKAIDDLDNNDLWKIFEYFTCIKLTKKFKRKFYEYDDIDLDFKENNKLSRSDTGIDCCDLDNTIVQCKLREKSLTWKDCATFFASQMIFCSKEKKPIIRWNNLIIARNAECILSKNLACRAELFNDIKYKRDELIKFCETLIKNPPKYPVVKNIEIILRDYQKECIKLITQQQKNVVISLPTGTGKNIVIMHSFKDNLKYLILVPTIILMEQINKEIIKYKPELKNQIQLIGDGNDNFNKDKGITICVYNSIHKIDTAFSNFEKIFVDEEGAMKKFEFCIAWEEFINDYKKYL